ncbi:hypothetical protein [Marinitoga lauensis]|uniref:hypothetical protein n=1 Tax=Marinitoga lauensis TaxID=2201189 RepID=UPI00197FC98E|nr:hypothetical protein [Marinitoga lauensis]
MDITNKELSNKFKKMMKNPSLLILIILIFISMFIFIIFPLYKVFLVSFTNSENHFSLETYKNALANDYMRQGFKNSILIAILTSVIGTFVGFLYAYTLNRANIPFKKFFRTIAIIPMVFPPFIGAMAIIMLFGFNGLLTAKLFGIRTFPVYGLWD